ncbi:YbbR-like domain-containing protein [Thermovibrio ammonificans]|jgi:hypothetical protein|uniref:YbbR family protein n=1 Tax=Thermovibrio ammonificans (strain DSM 15698 / JCM 12110 / HB-1) TaxID=648996 RepID=E8T1W3_THEA1|nr:hypothetical protein [Thermovibrio ammonificans]ADU96858.1 hypothetical protein Theam_0891 [Thermovibrio ammonificans HB-1]
MKRLYSVLFSNLHLKVLAFAFAVLFWLLATNKEVAETQLELKVRPIATGDYTVVSYRPKTVTLLVEGYRKELLALKEKKEVEVKLPKELKSGVNVIEVNRNNLQLPVPSVKVKTVQPKEIKVTIELLAKKLVRVEPGFKVKKGWRVEFDPNYVTVFVPEEIKEVIDSVQTEGVSLAGVKPPASFVLRLDTPFKVFPGQVKVTLKEEKGR